MEHSQSIQISHGFIKYLFEETYKTNSVLKVKSFCFIHSLGTLNLEFASWQNSGPETNHKCLEDYYIDYRCQYYYKSIFRFKM